MRKTKYKMIFEATAGNNSATLQSVHDALAALEKIIQNGEHDIQVSNNTLNGSMSALEGGVDTTQSALEAVSEIFGTLRGIINANIMARLKANASTGEGDEGGEGGEGNGGMPFPMKGVLEERMFPIAERAMKISENIGETLSNINILKGCNSDILTTMNSTASSLPKEMTVEEINTEIINALEENITDMSDVFTSISATSMAIKVFLEEIVPFIGEYNVIPEIVQNIQDIINAISKVTTDMDANNQVLVNAGKAFNDKLEDINNPNLQGIISAAMEDIMKAALAIAGGFAEASNAAEQAAEIESEYNNTEVVIDFPDGDGFGGDPDGDDGDDGDDDEDYHFELPDDEPEDDEDLGMDDLFVDDDDNGDDSTTDSSDTDNLPDNTDELTPYDVGKFIGSLVAKGLYDNGNNIEAMRKRFSSVQLPDDIPTLKIKK